MERMKPVVRQAVIQDLPRLVPLFDEYRIYFKQEARPEAVAQFLFEKFEHRESVVYVVESGEGTLVGFAQLYPIFSSLSLERVWLLNDFFIAEAFREQGMGGYCLMPLNIMPC